MTHEQINEAAKLIKKWENTGLYIDDSSSLSIAEIRSKTIIAYQKLGVRKVYIDYLQLCKGTGFNREQEISSVSRGLKNLAKELNIPVTALAQLSREVEKRADKRPQLSDLRESGSIEQDADMVQFLFRPEYYGITQFEDGSDAEKKLVNIIAKNRNGATTDIVEYCDIACGRIGDKWENNLYDKNYRKMPVSKENWNTPTDYKPF
jgi:replicative DNA helicase